MWRFSSQLAPTDEISSELLEVLVRLFQQGTMRVEGGGVNPRNNLLETEIEGGLRLERFGLV
jgi:hypothetical protein